MTGNLLFLTNFLQIAQVLHVTFIDEVLSYAALLFLFRFRLLVVGSEDKQVRVVSAVDNLKNLFVHALAAHKAEVVGSHFCHNSYDVNFYIFQLLNENKKLMWGLPHNQLNFF